MRNDELTLILDVDGENELNPDDFFTDVAKPVSEWLKLKITGDSNASEIRDAYLAGARRIELFLKAQNFVVAQGCNLDDLRKEPHVLEIYDYSNAPGEVIGLVYFFKEDNNGTTYRVLQGAEITPQSLRRSYREAVG